MHLNHQNISLFGITYRVVDRWKSRLSTTIMAPTVQCGHIYLCLSRVDGRVRAYKVIKDVIRISRMLAGGQYAVLFDEYVLVTGRRIRVQRPINTTINRSTERALPSATTQTPRMTFRRGHVLSKKINEASAMGANKIPANHFHPHQERHQNLVFRGPPKMSL